MFHVGCALAFADVGRTSLGGAFDAHEKIAAASSVPVAKKISRSGDQRDRTREDATECAKECAKVDEAAFRRRGPVLFSMEEFSSIAGVTTD